MKVIFEINGKQYSLTENEQILKIDYNGKTKPGGEIISKKILVIDERFGHPFIEDNYISLVVLSHGICKKHTVMKYKAKTRFNKVFSYSSRYTRVKCSLKNS